MQACSRESKMPLESRTDWSVLCVHQPPPIASPARVMSGNWQIIKRARLIRTGDRQRRRTGKEMRWSESKADRQSERERERCRRGEREGEKHNSWAVNGLIKFEKRAQIKSEGKQDVSVTLFVKLKNEENNNKNFWSAIETLLEGVFCDKFLTLMSN